MKLTEMQVRNAVPRDKLYRLGDGSAMYLLVLPTGGRYWRLDFTLHGRRRTAALGVYPFVSLKEARIKRELYKQKVARGEDPIVQGLGSTFGEIADEWIERKVATESGANTLRKTKWMLQFTKNIRGQEITTLTTPDMLQILRKVEARGRHETAVRLRSVCSRVFRYAIATGRAERNPCGDLGGALTQPKVTHRAAILDPERAGAMLRAITAYTGAPAMGVAMRMSILTFVRPIELRLATWEEIDIEAAIWRIPAARMKMKRDHIVPLSRQSLACLDRLQEFYVPQGYLFPSPRKEGQPYGISAVSRALIDIGFAGDEVTQHGFRRMASTMLNERGFHRDWIERQLAHIEQNQVRGAYNAAEYLEGRTQMVQAWADLLDEFESAGVKGSMGGDTL